jgi:hypothetical protein
LGSGSSGGDQQTGFGALPATLQNFGTVPIKGTEWAGYGSNDPYAGVPGLIDLYRQGPQSPFPGQQYANLTPQQIMGMQSQVDFATNQMPGLLNQTFGSLGNALNAGNMYSDPSVQAGLSTIEDRANRNFMQNTLPNIRRQATGSGNQYSSKAEQAEFSKAYDKDQMIGDAQANFLAQQLGSARNLQGRALGFAPQTMNAGFTPGEMQFNVGSINQAQHQAGIDQNMANYAFQQNAPWDLINKYNLGMGQISGMGAGNSIVPNNTGVNPWAGALGGAQLGFNFANSMFPSTPSLPPPSPYPPDPYANAWGNGIGWGDN